MEKSVKVPLTRIPQLVKEIRYALERGYVVRVTEQGVARYRLTFDQETAGEVSIKNIIKLSKASPK